MSERERAIRQARRLITDQQLFEFFRAIRTESAVFAVKLINEELDKGGSLDAIFYTGNEEGFTLEVNRESGSTFTVSFGCLAGPCAGDGGEWRAKFDENGRLISAKGGSSWIS